MEDEKFISGYCRQTDRSRTVTVELKDGTVNWVDCSYETCPHRQTCPIAKQIRDLNS